MKQAMKFDANQTNILQMWEVETSRKKHLGRLNTIYRDKSLTMQNRSIQESPNYYMLLHLKNKEKDMQRKQRSLQQQIDYENQLLRMKLIDATIPEHVKSRISSHNQEHISEVESSTNKDDRSSKQQRRFKHQSESYFKKLEKSKIMEENSKLFVKLAAMKSNIMERLNIKDHQKRTEQIKEKLEKRSPKKVKMLRSFFKRKHQQQVRMMSAGKEEKGLHYENEEESM